MRNKPPWVKPYGFEREVCSLLPFIHGLKKPCFSGSLNKLLLLIVIFASVFTISGIVSKTAAQSVELTAFDRALQRYNQSVETYKKEHADYVLARSQYERFGTLASKNAAFEETLQMLISRDQVVIDYFITLKEKVLASPGLEENEVTETVSKLDQGIGWFNDHKNKLSSAGNLEDLTEDSELAKETYDDMLPIIYEGLSVPAFGLVTDYENRLKNLHTGLKAKFEEINKDQREEYQLSSRKSQLIDKWLIESELRFVRSQEKRLEAKKLINELSEIKRIRSGNYDDVMSIIYESRQHLKESINFMNEILKEVKTTN